MTYAVIVATRQTPIGTAADRPKGRPAVIVTARQTPAGTAAGTPKAGRPS